MNAFRRLISFVILCVVLAFTSVESSAHNRSQSFSTWRVSDSAVRLTFSVLTREATRLVKTNGEYVVLEQTLARHLIDNIQVSSIEGICKTPKGATPLRARDGHLAVEIIFDCQGYPPSDIRFDAFFATKADHTNFAKVLRQEGQSEGVFTFANRDLNLGPNAIGQSAGQRSGFFTFVRLGIRHMGSGLDHLAFLLALLLLVTQLRQVLFVVTGFTLGHSITLSLAVLGVATPNVPLVEATIGFTIALVALENIAIETRLPNQFAVATGLFFGFFVLVTAISGQGPSWTAMAGLGLFGACYLALAGDRARALQLRPALTVLFGLVHGFGFSAVLNELDLPTSKLAKALLGFNIGVEIGQLVAVAIFGLVLYAINVRFSSIAHRRLTDVLSAGLLGLGLYWFVIRAFVI